jgi:hypothetical protein
MSTTTPMLSVYDGRQCVGWVLARGRRGYEAFTAGERSLGMFDTRDAAVDECVKTKVNKHE